MHGQVDGGGKRMARKSAACTAWSRPARSSTSWRSLSETESADLQLEPAESEAVARDASDFARALADPTARARYEQLSLAASAGVVPAHLVAALETMLELLFEKGRPSNPAVLQSVFGKTPRGRQKTLAARDVNEALRTLSGQRLDQLRLSAGPSRHTLVIQTDARRLTLELDAAGARVASLEAG